MVTWLQTVESSYLDSPSKSVDIWRELEFPLISYDCAWYMYV